MTKRSLVLPLVLVAAELCMAQDWALLNPAYRYNYALDGVGAISNQIFVTNMETLGTDSFQYEMNQVAEICDICSMPDPDNCWSVMNQGTVHTNGPQFLGWQMVSSPSGIVLYGRDTLQLFINGAEGSSWSFNDTLTATFVNTELAAPFGVPDSIRSILLSSGDGIVLSKSYGMLSFPQLDPGAGGHHVLVGVEGAGVGDHFPTRRDFFDYSIGDVIQYSGHNWAATGMGLSECYSTTKYTILSKTSVGEDFHYTMRKVTNRICWGGIAGQSYAGIDTITGNTGGCGLFRRGLPHLQVVAICCCPSIRAGVQPRSSSGDRHWRSGARLTE